MKKVLITPQGFSFIKDKIKDRFSLDYDYIFTDGIVNNKKKLKDLLSNCHAVVIGSETIDKEIIDCAHGLELIVRFGTSTENIDTEYLKEKDIKLFKIKSSNTVEGVSRLCVSFVLNYVFNIQKHTNDSSKQVWKRYMNLDPDKINIGLIGSGDIASSFYNYGQSLGFNFNYHSRNEKQLFKSKGIKYFTGIKDLIEACDIISLHVPYNEETKNLISEQELSYFNNKLLINTSRAGIVSREALVESISKLNNFYYFTDVWYTEPPKDDDLKLISHENIFSTAHIGGYSESALIDVALQSLEIINTEF